MRFPSLSDVPGDVVLRDLDGIVANDHTTTARMLHWLGEVDERKLHVPAGYPSLHAYCLEHLHMSEDEAGRRKHVARKARMFPAVLEAIHSGRLHLTGASLLVPHLTRANVDELLTAAAHQSKAEIELLVARRFPRPDLPTTLRPARVEHVLRHVPATETAAVPMAQHVPEHAPGFPEIEHVPEHAPVSEAGAPAIGHAPILARSTLKPISAESHVLRATLDAETLELLKDSQELEGLPPGPTGIVETLKRALRTRVALLRKQKFAATDKPRATNPVPSRNPRRISAPVKRAVYARDQGRCTFVSDAGHRCDSRRVEFDHIVPVARGGKATAGNLRLRCRAHNQYAAEQAFGAEFMKTKRETFRRKADALRAKTQERARAALAEVAARVERAGDDSLHPRKAPPESIRGYR